MLSFRPFLPPSPIHLPYPLTPTCVYVCVCLSFQTNYMFEMPWLLKTVPRLESVPWLAVYGDHHTGEIRKTHPNISTYKPGFKSQGYPWGE